MKLETKYDFSMIFSAISKRTLLTQDKVWVLYKNLLATDYLDGAIAEFGVYQGGSARLFSYLAPKRKLYLFDTFEGMPEDDIAKNGHKKDDFNNTSLESVKAFVGQSDDITYKKGFFPNTTEGIENMVFSFVHLDADIYQSTIEGLKFFYPRLQTGGRLILDDHMWRSCLGVKQAVDEYFLNIQNDVYMLKEAKYSLTVIKK